VNYSVLWALREDFNEGWIWIRDSDLRARVELSRPIVRIRVGKKTAYCEAVWAGESYFNRFRAAAGDIAPSSRVVFISDWYRRRLGIATGEADLDIQFSRRPLSRAVWRLLACFQHPQVVVVLATSLGIIGVGLGVMGLGFGVISVQQWGQLGQDCGLSLVGLGALVVGGGAAPLVAQR